MLTPHGREQARERPYPAQLLSAPSRAAGGRPGRHRARLWGARERSEARCPNVQFTSVSHLGCMAGPGHCTHYCAGRRGGPRGAFLSRSSIEGQGRCPARSDERALPSPLSPPQKRRASPKVKGCEKAQPVTAPRGSREGRRLRPQRAEETGERPTFPGRRF